MKNLYKEKTRLDADNANLILGNQVGTLTHYFTLDSFNLELKYLDGSLYENHKKTSLCNDFDILFRDIHKKDIPYYFFNVDNKNSPGVFNYYVDEGYEISAREIKNLVFSICNIKKYEEILIEDLLSLKLNKTTSLEIVDNFKKLLKDLVFESKYKIDDEIYRGIHPQYGKTVNINYLYMDCFGSKNNLETFLYSEIMKISDCDGLQKEIYDFLVNINPLFVLKCLLENKNKLKYKLQLRKSKLIDNIPLVTLMFEGVSDVKIIKKCLEERMPTFVKFYHLQSPTNGGGSSFNLTMFKDFENSIIDKPYLFIFDNDVEGNINFNECKKNKTKSSLHLITLPNLSLKDLSDFTCVFKQGFKNPTNIVLKNYSINKKAVAIESFLDLNAKEKHRMAENKSIYTYKAGQHEVLVGGSNGREEQGAIRNKDTYSQYFIRRKNFDNYSFHKIDKLIKFIINKTNKLF